MSAQSDREYLLNRERHARQMAQNATDSLTRNIHNDLAKRYAQRAEAFEPADTAPIEA